MEVAGLILGAIPILLEGIDKYCELYGEWVKSTDLLAKRRRQLTIEHLKLKHALAYLSPDLIEEEVNARLVLWYPDECSTIVGTIMDLNQTIWKLRERMDIDEKGRPRSTHRVRAEWSRVKRSFKKKEIDELFHEIHRYNDNLRICFEGKREISSDMTNSSTSQQGQKFSNKICQEARKQVRMVHEAIGNAYDDDCVNEHLNMVYLSWYRHGFEAHQVLDVLFPDRDSCSQKPTCWCTARIKFEANSSSEDGGQVIQSTPTTYGATASPSIAPISGKRLQKARFLTPEDSARPLSSPMSTMRAMGPPSHPPLRKPIHSICSTPSEKLFDGYLLHSDCDEEQKIILESSQFIKNSLRVTDWRSFLPDATMPNLGLRRYRKGKMSKKDRLAIASAATWAVIILCGTPWFEETQIGWNDIALLTKEVSDIQNSPANLQAFPVFTYQFKSTSERNTQECSDGDSDHAIPHVALFSLAVILIETGLGKSFKEICEQFGSPFAGFEDRGSLIESYKIADDAAEDLYDELGDAYADAVRRCLRFNFPGRKNLQNFNNESLRKHFFLGVVVPVQERYKQEQTRHRIFEDN